MNYVPCKVCGKAKEDVVIRILPPIAKTGYAALCEDCYKSVWAFAWNNEDIIK